MSITAPGPRAIVPGLGPQLALLRLARDPLARMEQLFDRYGDVVALTRGGGPRVFSSNRQCPGTVLGRGAAFVREIEVDGATYHRSAMSGRLYPHDRHDPRHQALKEWATGLFAVNDEEHARHRKLMAPAFVRRRIEPWAPTIVDVTRRMLEDWRDGDRVDIHSWMMELTLRVATHAFFGEEIGREGSVARTLEASLKTVLSPGVLLAPFDLPGLPYRRFLDNVVEFNREMRRIVARRREEGATGGDVLSALIQASEADDVGLTDSEVVGHASVIFAAGHETTSNALVWMVFFLAQHPEVAAAVTEEIQSVLRGGDPTPGDLKAMPLLERVVLESLRVMPPAPWNTRTTTCDTELLGHQLDAGTEVIASIHHTHRVPDVWPDAARFLPARWETAKPTTYEFNPFGGGARSCPGGSFAMMEMCLVLSVLLSRFRLESSPTDRIDPVVNITMSLRSGMPMRVRSQDGAWEKGWVPVPGDVHRYVELTR